MAHPDPFKTSRRPQARAGGDIRVAPSRLAGECPPIFDAEGRLDVDALQRVVELAEAVSEGRAYGGREGARTFFGSTSIVLDLAHAGDATGETSLSGRLAASVEGDARARIVVRDRVYRELARLLGAETPAEFELSFSARAEGSRVRVLVDFEAPLEPARATDVPGG